MSARRLLLEISPAVDVPAWQRRHARGEVPDRLPYGLHLLADHGYRPTCRSWPGWRDGPAARVLTRRLSRVGGMPWLESALGAPSPSWADARLVWDERLGVPALLDPRSRRPVVSGVIWLTEDDARLGPGLRAAVRRALSRADGVFVLSSAQVPRLVRDWRVPARRVHHVPFGVDTGFWSAEHLGARVSPDPRPPDGEAPPDGRAPDGEAPPDGHRVVLGVGNDRHRAHDVLVDAVRQVRQRRPDVRLHLVTRRAVDLEPELGRRHPYLEHTHLRRWYARASVVAVATRSNLHVSGITTILEAMALGRPVVATATPGMDDYVQPGVTGLLVPPGDPTALAAAVTTLLDDPAQAEALAAAARARVLAEHSSHAQAARLAAVLTAASG
jgi:glycosyltransferase involved in cell wall biosynthesis